MSVLSDFLVADRASAIGYLKGQWAPANTSLRVEARGVTDIEVGTLWAVLAGEEFDFDRHELEPLDVEGNGLVYELSASVVSLLQALQSSQIPESAKAWAATEEFFKPAGFASTASAPFKTLPESAGRAPFVSLHSRVNSRDSTAANFASDAKSSSP